MLRLAATGAVAFAFLAAPDAAAQSAAYQAQYERAEAALVARHEREEEEEKKRCDAIMEQAYARMGRDLSAGIRESTAYAEGIGACRRSAAPMRQRHQDQWDLLEDAYERRWPLPDFESDRPDHIDVNNPERDQQPPDEPVEREPNSREQEARDRRELEDRISEERARLDELIRSRDEFGNNQSLERDIIEAGQRVEQAENDYIDHLREHAPHEARAYEEMREQIARRMENPRRMEADQGPNRNPDPRPPVRELEGYDGPEGTNPDHVFTDVEGRRSVSPGPVQNPSPPSRPASPPLPTYSPPGGGR